MIDEYRSGRTPNPDVLCNTRIKFGGCCFIFYWSFSDLNISLCDLDYRYCLSIFGLGAFLEAVESMKFDFIASGHFAHVTHPSFDRDKMPSILSLSKDMVPSLLHLLFIFFPS